MSAPDPGSPGLWRALATGVSEVERLLARAGQGVGLLGSVAALFVAVVVDLKTGAPLLCVTVSAFLWYTAVHALLRRGFWAGPLRFLTTGVEVAVPVASLVILWLTQGPEYALGSWVPPQVWSVFLAASILRFDARVPVFLGTLAATSYAVLWFALFRPTLVDRTLLLYRDDMQMVRIGSLFLTGVVGSLAVVALRRTLDRAAAQLREEELFGKYRLGDKIASGGMGTVHEALYCPEGGFRRRVAVKLIHPHLASDPSFVERFRQEAEIGARLVHPNIVQTLDFGRVRDTLFLALEFVDGRPLSDVLQERKTAGQALPVRMVAWIAHQVASALDHAHAGATDEAGKPLRVVHRDLSPANVLVDRGGRVRLTDFGVAHALRDTTQVHTRQLVGKPGYMAPEALDGSGVDPRADLWALGVVIWEMLANRRLFGRETEAAALHAVTNAEIPSIGLVRPELASGWMELVDQLLVRDREQRLATAAHARDRLAVLVAAEGVPTTGDLALAVAPDEEVDELPLDATEEAPKPAADHATPPTPPRAAPQRPWERKTSLPPSAPAPATDPEPAQDAWHLRATNPGTPSPFPPRANVPVAEDATPAGAFLRVAPLTEPAPAAQPPTAPEPQREPEAQLEPQVAPEPEVAPEPHVAPEPAVPEPPPVDDAPIHHAAETARPE